MFFPNHSKNIMYIIPGRGKRSPSPFTALKKKLSCKNFFSKCHQIPGFLWFRLFLYQHPCLVVLWASYYTYYIIRNVNPLFWKVYLFSDKHIIINYCLKKGYIYNSLVLGSYNIYIYIYIYIIDLHVIEFCLKVTIATFFILSFKKFIQISRQKLFNPFYIFSKKNFLARKY